jgi:hypothetical protein
MDNDEEEGSMHGGGWRRLAEEEEEADWGGRELGRSRPPLRRVRQDPSSLLIEGE